MRAVRCAVLFRPLLKRFQSFFLPIAHPCTRNLRTKYLLIDLVAFLHQTSEPTLPSLLPFIAFSSPLHNKTLVPISRPGCVQMPSLEMKISGLCSDAKPRNEDLCPIFKSICFSSLNPSSQLAQEYVTTNHSLFTFSWEFNPIPINAVKTLGLSSPAQC